MDYASAWNQFVNPPSTTCAPGWPDEAVAYVKTAWTRGDSASQIMRALAKPPYSLAKTRSAVIGIIHRRGLARRGKPSRPGVCFRARPAIRPAVKPAVWERAPNLPETIAADPRPVSFAAAGRLLELGEHDCRWPIGDPKDDDFHFCGAPATEGSYCAHHAEMAKSVNSDIVMKRSVKEALSAA